MSDHSSVRNAADPQQVKKAAKEDKIKDVISNSNLRFVMESKSGRAFLWELLSSCNMFNTSMTGDNYTFFLEGQRTVGLQLIPRMVAVSPKLYMLMQTENIEDDIESE